MAIFHLELRHISRKNKSGGSKSAASIVAYRERCRIGEFNYSNKTDFVTSFCLFPPEFSSSDFAEKMRNSTLFSEEIEKVEKRRDSQLFDEIILALPHEIELEQNQKIIEELIGEFYVRKNNQMARVCIHKSSSNLHAHILIPQRPLERTENGLGFGKKVREDFAKGKPKTSEKVILLRSMWAELVNRALSDVGVEKRISHLSLKDLKQEAERVFDFKTAELYDRSPLYLPVSAYKRAEFIVSKLDRFTIDFRAMHQARTFAARRAELKTLTLEELKAEQAFWRKTEDENRLRTGSIQLARKFAKRAEKQIFLKNEITEILRKNYETTGNNQRSNSDSASPNPRIAQHTTQLNIDSTGSSKYHRFDAVKCGSEICESNDSRNIFRRQGNETGHDERHKRYGLGSENSSRFSGIYDKRGNPNTHFDQQRKISNIFTTSGDGQSYYSGNSKCFESRATTGELSKSEREKNYRRTLSLVPKRRKRVS